MKAVKGPAIVSVTGIQDLPAAALRPVLLARALNAQILAEIEAVDYDVFRGRVRTSWAQKLIAAANVSFAPQGVLRELQRTKEDDPIPTFE